MAVALTLLAGGRVAGAQSLCDTPQCECDDTQSQVRCSCRKVPHESQVRDSNGKRARTHLLLCLRYDRNVNGKKKKEKVNPRPTPDRHKSYAVRHGVSKQYTHVYMTENLVGKTRVS